MIVGVALFNEITGEIVSLPKPNRHNDVIHIIYDRDRKQPGRSQGWIQGFYDEHNKFYDRYQAAKHVCEIGQDLTKYAQEEYENRKLEILFSEDVW